MLLKEPWGLQGTAKTEHHWGRMDRAEGGMGGTVIPDAKEPRMPCEKS